MNMNELNAKKVSTKSVNLVDKLKPFEFTTLSQRDDLLKHLMKLRKGTHNCTHAQAEKIMAVWSDLPIVCPDETFTFAEDFKSFTKL